MREATAETSEWEVPRHQPETVDDRALTSSEPRPRRWGWGWVAIGTLALVAAGALGVVQLFDDARLLEVRTRQLEPPNAILRATRTEEQARLTQYRWVKRSDGVLRIPVARARELVLQEYAQPAASASAGSRP